MNKKMISLVLGMTLSLTNLFAAEGGGGGVIGGGGGDFELNSIKTLEQLLKQGGLKKALVHYLETIDVDKIENKKVKDTLAPIIKDGSLIQDIQTTEYLLTENCIDVYNHEVPAAAYIGDLGGNICFNPGMILNQLKNPSSKDLMVELAALVLHEHIHHFQSSAKAITENEAEAYEVSAYFKITAKILQVPVLKWEPIFLNSSPSELFEKFPAPFGCVYDDSQEPVKCNIPSAVEVEDLLNLYEAELPLRLEKLKQFNDRKKKILSTILSKKFDGKLGQVYSDYAKQLEKRLELLNEIDYRQVRFENIIGLNSRYHSFLKELKAQLPGLRLYTYSQLISHYTTRYMIDDYEDVLERMDMTMEDMVQKVGRDVGLSSYLNLNTSCKNAKGFGRRGSDLDLSSIRLSFFESDGSWLHVDKDEEILNKLLNAEFQCKKDKEMRMAYDPQQKVISLGYSYRYYYTTDNDFYFYRSVESALQGKDLSERLRKLLSE